MNAEYRVVTIVDDDNDKHIGFILQDVKTGARSSMINTKTLYFYRNSGAKIHGVTLCKNGVVKADSNIPRKKLSKVDKRELKARVAANNRLNTVLTDKDWQYIVERVKKEYGEMTQENLYCVLDDIGEGSKIYALASYLRIPIYEIKQGYDSSTFEVGDNVYAVYTESEADSLFVEYERDIIEDSGLNSFSKDFQQWIIHYGLYESRMSSIAYNYYDDSEDEMSDEVREEINENPVRYIIDNFGLGELKQILEDDKSLFNISAICSQLMKLDGRGFVLASADGNEIEYGNYFIYKLG